MVALKTYALHQWRRCRDGCTSCSEHPLRWRHCTTHSASVAKLSLVMFPSPAVVRH